MRIVKSSLLVLGTCLVVANLAGLFMSRTFEVSAERTVKGARATVFNYVNTPEHVVLWLPWLHADTTVQYTFAGSDNGSGAGFTWTISNNEQGSWQTIRSTPPSSVHVLTTSSDFGEAIMHFDLYSKGERTNVRWSIAKDMGPVPMFRLLVPFFKDYVVADLRKGLSNLDSLLQSLPQGVVGEVTPTTVSAMNVLAYRLQCKRAELGATIAKIFGTIIHEASVQHVSLDLSKPLMLTHHTAIDTARVLDIEGAICTTRWFTVTPPVQSQVLGGGTYLRIRYNGPYEQLSKAHHALEEYAKKQGVAVGSSVMEWFITDPATTLDVRNWRTDVYRKIIQPQFVR